MKKFLFLGIAATAMLASCTNDETVEMNPQNAIGFEMFVDKSTRAAEDVTTANLTAFEVYGWRGDALIFNAQAVTANNGTCTYSPLQYWVGGYAYTFEAVAPKSGDNGVTFAPSKDASTITFVSDSETDLIYAAGSKDLTGTANLTTDPGTVDLTFSHLLSRVKFSFVNGFPAESDVKLTVTDVKITNAGTTAVYTPSTTTWAAATATGEVTFASPAVANVASGNTAAETEHKYLIPYEVKDYTLTFTVTMAQGGVEDTFNHSVNLSTKSLVLLAGYSYDFTATLNAENINPQGNVYPIVFTAEVNPWGDFEEEEVPFE
ncbi:MAG: fimbrillin family protein [Bacteroidaceae bacterium]|nr:fimbrillin family protein [Bacteroidaceae bacterium]